MGRRLHGRPEEDLPAVLRQVVQPRGRDVFPAARGHPPRPPDQRAHHLRERHEGQVHQAHPQEGLQVREQVRQAAGEGRQVRIRQPAEGEVKCVLTAFKKHAEDRGHKTHSKAVHKNYLFAGKHKHQHLHRYLDIYISRYLAIAISIRRAARWTGDSSWPWQWRPPPHKPFSKYKSKKCENKNKTRISKVLKVALSPNRMPSPGWVPAPGHRSPCCAVLPVLPPHLPTQCSKYIQFSPGIIIVS